MGESLHPVSPGYRHEPGRDQPCWGRNGLKQSFLWVSGHFISHLPTTPGTDQVAISRAHCHRGRGCPHLPAPHWFHSAAPVHPALGRLGTPLPLNCSSVWVRAVAASQLCSWGLRPRTSLGKPGEGRTHLASSCKQQHLQDCRSQPGKGSGPSPVLPSGKSLRCRGNHFFFPYHILPVPVDYFSVGPSE